MNLPQYLAAPELEGHSYGTLDYESATNRYVVQAEPVVLEVVKRLFPGTQGRINNHDGRVRFAATKRTAGDINWLLLRYPLDIKCPERFLEDRAKAIDHAETRAANATLGPSVPPATFKGKLMPYQAEGLTFLLRNERTLLADDMGLGKTVSALASIAAAQAFPALIVVPTNVQRQWCEMAAAFLDLPSTDLLQTQATRLKGRKPYAIPETPIVVIHYGLLADWCDHLRGHGFKCIVFDEVQDLRHTGTAKYSAASALSIEADFVWGLSGTPIYNYGSEIWAVMNAIEFQCLGDWESFSREWCIGYGEKIIAQPDVLGNHLKREGLMLRRLKTEVQSQLPDKVRSVVDIDHDESVYRKLAEEAIQLARGYDTIKEFKEKGMAARKMDEQARRATGVSKAPYVAEYVNTLIEAGERPIVFAWHHDVHDILRENIAEGKAVSITGRENEMQKRDALYRFAAGEVSCCILSLRSTAGLDGLQKAGTCVVFAELDWSPAVHAQCEDRLHRIGLAAANLFCYYLVSGTSFDLVIQETLGLKVGQFINIMGDPGESEESKEKAKTATEAHMKKLIRQLRKAA